MTRTQILLLVLFFLLSNSADSAAVKPKIISVDLVCLNFPQFDKKRFLEFIDIALPTPYSEQLVKKAVLLLNQTQQFQEVKAETTQTAAGVKLVFKVIAAHIIKEVEIQKNGPLFKSEIKRKLTIKPGEKYVPEKIEAQIATISEAYRKEGYYHTMVEVLKKDKGLLRTVIFKIKLGYTLKYRDIWILGNTAFDYLKLNKLLKKRRFILKEFRKNAKEIELLYRRKGYFKARVRYRYKIDVEKRQVDVFVWIREGTQVSIEFVGNKSLSAEDLKKVLPMYETGDFDKEEVINSIDKLKDLYENQGYFFVSISHQLKKHSENLIYLRYVIAEHKKVRISRIEFTGNQHFPHKTLLKKMQTKPYSFLTESGYLVSKILVADLKKVQDFYKEMGFLKCSLKHTIQIVKKGRRLKIIIEIVEGRPVLLMDVTLQGNRLFSETQLLKHLQIVKSNPLVLKGEGQKLIESPVKMITEVHRRIMAFYRDKGYYNTQVKLQRLVDPKDPYKIKLVVVIKESPQVRFGKVFITGNFKTRESIIRRDLPLKKGDPFTLKAIYTGRSNLRAINLFDAVNTKQIGLKEGLDEISILVNVDESKYQFIDFSVLANFQIYEQTPLFEYGLQAKYTNNNVLGFGKRFEFLVKTLFGGNPDSIKIPRDCSSWYCPRLLMGLPMYTDRRFLGSKFDLFLSVKGGYFGENINYERQQIGGSIKVAHKIVKDLYASLEYAIDFGRNRGYYILEGTQKPGVQTIYIEQPDYGDFQPTSHLKPRLTYDRRDNPLNPTRGFYLDFLVDFSSKYFGSAASKQFIITSFSAEAYLKVWRLVFAFNFKMDWGFPLGGGDAIQAIPLFCNSSNRDPKTTECKTVPILPVEQLFLVGGDMSVRGYPKGLLSPRALFSSTDSDNMIEVAFGGNVRLLFSHEIRFQIYKDFWGAVFFDLGSTDYSFGDFTTANFGFSVGLGIRYLILGIIPIRLDYGFIVGNKSNGIAKLNSNFEGSILPYAGEFYLSVGYSF